MTSIVVPDQHPVVVEPMASRINAAVREANEHAHGAVLCAIRAGVLLQEAKEQVSHGQWGVWLREHVAVAPRTAQAYMRLAQATQGLPLAEAQRVADLPLREALRAIATAPTPPARSRGLRPGGDARRLRDLTLACGRKLDRFGRDLGRRTIKLERITALRKDLMTAVAELDRLADYALPSVGASGSGVQP